MTVESSELLQRTGSVYKCDETNSAIPGDRSRLVTPLAILKLHYALKLIESVKLRKSNRQATTPAI